MKTVILVVSNGVSGVPKVKSVFHKKICINIPIWHFTPKKVQILLSPPKHCNPNLLSPVGEGFGFVLFIA